jgi:hypothetical protein
MWFDLLVERKQGKIVVSDAPLILFWYRNHLGVKNAVFWDVAPCKSCVNRRFGGTYLLHCRFTQYLHGATSQKTPFFIVTAVKTSNLTSSRCDLSISHLWLELLAELNQDISATSAATLILFRY